MEWKPISTAPFKIALELAVIDGGEVHALVFPCRRTLDGWHNAETKERIDLWPTHWRAWQPTVSGFRGSGLVVSAASFVSSSASSLTEDLALCFVLFIGKLPTEMGDVELSDVDALIHDPTGVTVVSGQIFSDARIIVNWG
jgi:hypothetical protein